METVAIDDVDIQVNPLQVHDVRRPVSKALGTDHVAMNYFELAPGDSFSGGLHAHHDQEELFYVESGTAEFEVGREREIVTVDAGEVIRFEPGEFQKGYNPEDSAEDADEQSSSSPDSQARQDVVGWAIGAPGASHDWDELESIVYCQECEEERAHETRINSEGRFEFTCSECGNEFQM